MQMHIDWFVALNRRNIYPIFTPIHLCFSVSVNMVTGEVLLGFPSWCPKSTRPMDSCFQGTSCENLMMYGGLYEHTHVVLYMYPYISNHGKKNVTLTFKFKDQGHGANALKS